MTSAPTATCAQGYGAVFFGFLDQWDEDLSFLEYYGRSEAVPGLIPAHFRDQNRAELRRRLEITARLGLSVYMSIASPLGPKSKVYLDNRDPMQSGGSYPGGFCNDPRAQFGEYLGPDEELCVGHPEVRRYYRELIADIVASFPEVRGFAIFGGDFYSSMCRPGDCPRCGDSTPTAGRPRSNPANGRGRCANCTTAGAPSARSGPRPCASSSAPGGAATR